MLLLSTVTSVAALMACSDAMTTHQVIAPADLARLLASDSAPLVLDVRAPGEYRNGHVPAALNIPHVQVGARLTEIPSDRHVVVYCEEGPRAEYAESVLKEAGYNVLHLDGDMAGWRRSRLPVETR
jgi:rhodanese-related sulfurtransferase